MVTDKERKQEREKELINFLSSCSLPLLVCRLLRSSSKVHLRRASVPPSVSHTKADAERTHTTRMDVVKKEKIYKGAETLGAERDREGGSESPLSRRLFNKGASKKAALR